MTKPKTPKPPGERRDVATRFKPGVSGSPATQNGPGRPHQGFPIPGPGGQTRLNDALIADFARVLPEGGIRPACRRLGVDRASFQTWRKRGEQDRASEIFDTIHAKFSFAVDKALGEEEARIYRGIMDGSIDTRAGTFVLERRFDYTAKTSIEINETGDPGHARQRIQDLFATTVAGTIDVSATPERRDAESDEPRSPLALPSGTEPGGQ